MRHHQVVIPDAWPPGLGELGRLEITALAETVARHAASEGPFAVRTLGARSELGLALLRHGLVADGVSLFESLVRDHTDHWGPDHSGTLACMVNLGWSYRLAGRHTKALGLFERAFDLYSSDRGRIGQQGLIALHHIGRTLLVLERTDEAIAALEFSHNGLVTLLGPDHPSTVTARVGLASAYSRAQQPERAVSLLRSELDQRVQELGPDHPDTLTVTHNLGVALANSHQDADAIDLLDEVLTARLGLLGRSHPATLATQHALAKLYFRSGHRGKGRDLLRAILDDGREVLGSEHPIMIDAALHHS